MTILIQQQQEEHHKETLKLVDALYRSPHIYSYTVCGIVIMTAMMYASGSESLLSSAGLGIDWVRSYNVDPEAFSRL
jgi:hypothetical protein